MKITRYQLRRIIREEKRKLQEGAGLDQLEMAAMESDSIRMLFDAYIEETLDLSGSNRADALEYAYESMRKWTEDFIQQARRDEEDPEQQYGYEEY